MRLPRLLLTFADIRDEVERLYGKEAPFLAGRHHARRILPDVPIHVISRVFQGRFLLTPTNRLTRIINGVIARAQHNYQDVELNTYAFMSNHMHMMLKGPPDQVVDFIAFVKREISRRWGREPGIDWPGAMWHGYLSTALPTKESQLLCFRYICSHGVKEKIVSRAEHWKGANAAPFLLADGPVVAQWFDGTGYSRAVDAQRRRKKTKSVDRRRFVVPLPLQLTPIDPWRHLAPQAYRAEVSAMFDDIAEEGRLAREGSPPLGMKAARAIARNHRREIPRQPWLERGRAMICWADPRAPETRAYIEAYWQFQREFRQASNAYRDGDVNMAFPKGSFRPVLFEAGAALNAA